MRFWALRMCKKHLFQASFLSSPSDVVDVVSVVFEGMQGLVLLQAPQLDSPVHGGGQEEMAEVHIARGGGVRVQSGHRRLKMRHS